MLKLWQRVRGYKRQAGAFMAILPFILVQLGIADGQVEQWCKMIEIVGALIWGIGWADRTAVIVGKKTKEKLIENDPVLSAAEEALKK